MTTKKMFQWKHSRYIKNLFLWLIQAVSGGTKYRDVNRPSIWYTLIKWSNGRFYNDIHKWKTASLWTANQWTKQKWHDNQGMVWSKSDDFQILYKIIQVTVPSNFNENSLEGLMKVLQQLPHMKILRKAKVLEKEKKVKLILMKKNQV